MKIEMGESLMYSYLRHVKFCQIVQTNWKPSPSWTVSNSEKLYEIMHTVSEFYSDKYNVDIFGNNSPEQLMRQAEADVLGVCFNPEPFVYGIDVAFHEGGLTYGNKRETAARIVKKYVRTIMCIIGYLNFFEGEIIFASPKANPNVLNEMIPFLDDLKELLKSLKLNFSIKLYTNADFYNSILSPIMLQSTDISDTSELFLRSYQMIKLFEKPTKNGEKANKTTERANKDDNEYLSIAALDQLKIGMVVQLTINHMMENDLLSDDIIERLQSKSWCKESFGINFPLLKDISDCSDKDSMRKDSKGYNRYYTTPVNYKNKTYLLCQEWNDGLHRKKYDSWYKKLIDIKE